MLYFFKKSSSLLPRTWHGYDEQGTKASSKIMNIMALKSGVLVIGRCSSSHIVNMIYFFSTTEHHVGKLSTRLYMYRMSNEAISTKKCETRCRMVRVTYVKAGLYHSYSEHRTINSLKTIFVGTGHRSSS